MVSSVRLWLERNLIWLISIAGAATMAAALARGCSPKFPLEPPPSGCGEAAIELGNFRDEPILECGPGRFVEISRGTDKQSTVVFCRCPGLGADAGTPEEGVAGAKP